MTDKCKSWLEKRIIAARLERKSWPEWMRKTAKFDGERND